MNSIEILTNCCEFHLILYNFIELSWNLLISLQFYWNLKLYPSNYLISSQIYWNINWFISNSIKFFVNFIKWVVNCHSFPYIFLIFIKVSKFHIFDRKLAEILLKMNWFYKIACNFNKIYFNSYQICQLTGPLRGPVRPIPAVYPLICQKIHLISIKSKILYEIKFILQSKMTAASLLKCVTFGHT